MDMIGSFVSLEFVPKTNPAPPTPGDCLGGVVPGKV
jgi:hypothetical protein